MNLEQAILATLAYSDIFDYPLTFEELHQKLVFKKITKDSLSGVLQRLVDEKKILKFAKFYQLAGTKRLARKRLQRKKYAQKKLKKATLAAKILSWVPYVKFVGISGALASGNTPKNDDIDLFVITASGKIFTTRFFCNLLLDFANLRRKPKSDKVADKICLNMFLTENNLKLAPHDIYLAHEILQTGPLFERNAVYSRFFQQNLWVLKFLPNWPASAYFASRSTSTQAKSALAGKSTFNFIENFFKKIQLKYMKKKITRETISDTKLFFHPEDAHQKVLTKFSHKLKRLNIPLTDIS